MGVALENARLFDETKRLLAETNDRAAELAVINEIGSALARQLDFQAIIDLVGERVGTIFESRSLFIALHDPERDTLTFPYDQDEGKRVPARRVQGGSRAHVDRAEKRPIAPDRDDRGADGRGRPPGRRLGHPVVAGGANPGRQTASSALSASRASIRMPSRRRTSGSSTRSSASLGVALENARLFDETKHLLAQTDQRAAELAVINEIGSALAQQLEFQSIVDLVGERVRSIFNPQSMFISLYDPATNMIAFPYANDARHPRRAAGAA